MGQLDPKQPAANHAEFVKIILSEIARCVVTTYGTLAGDFSGHNYASGRRIQTRLSPSASKG